MSIAPPLRCGHRNENSNAPFCTAPARFARLAPGERAALFICGEHRLPTDQPIVDGTPVRLVTLTCRITFAGVSQRAELSEAEAASRLELACLGAGGLVSIVHTTSTTGRHRAPRPARTRRDEPAE